MIDLYTAFELTDTKKDDVIRLQKDKEHYDIITRGDAERTYNLQRIQVRKIAPWFMSGDYHGFIFYIVI